jgi:organic hydroperoxide reductase OsmC/OhrA
MPTRDAHARWEGSLKAGHGAIDFGNGLFKGPYSFGSRFEDRAGTNPEALLGAVHASCFAMALSVVLGEAGFTPESTHRRRSRSDHRTVATESPRATSSARPECPVSIQLSSLQHAEAANLQDQKPSFFATA